MYPGDQTGHFLPNSPEHQLHADGLLSLPHQMALSVGTDIFSRAYIDPINDRWIGIDGLMNARFSKGWQHKRYAGEFFVSGRNLTNRNYIAFTEPDYPDGHSYQPGPRARNLRRNGSSLLGKFLTNVTPPREAVIKLGLASLLQIRCDARAWEQPCSSRVAAE